MNNERFTVRTQIVHIVEYRARQFWKIKQNKIKRSRNKKKHQAKS